MREHSDLAHSPRRFALGVVNVAAMLAPLHMQRFGPCIDVAGL
jgi:hypothetical protein